MLAAWERRFFVGAAWKRGPVIDFFVAICFFGDKSALALVEDNCPSQQQEFKHLAHLVLTDSEDFCAECFASHG